VSNSALTQVSGWRRRLCWLLCAGLQAQTLQPGRSDADSWRTAAGAQPSTLSRAAVACATSDGESAPPPPPPPPPANSLVAADVGSPGAEQHAEATAEASNAAPEQASGWRDVLVAGCRDAQLRVWVTGCEVAQHQHKHRNAS
jgi:hypothetical protein